jgi:hypothetical protein
LLSRLESAAAELARLDAVERATVYRTVLAPPPSGYARKVERPARYDVHVLVETGSPDEITAVEATPPYTQLRKEFDTDASRVDVMRARCVKCIADVDKSRPGLFLFNYFVAEDPELALRIWEQLAGWYVAETGLDNSTLLAPIGDADYVLVNHARWDLSLPGFMLRQFTKPSFRAQVPGKMRANRIGAMPLLYRLT